MLGRRTDVQRTEASRWKRPGGEPKVWQRELDDTTAEGPRKCSNPGSRPNHQLHDCPVHGESPQVIILLHNLLQTSSGQALSLTHPLTPIFMHLRNARGRGCHGKGMSLLLTSTLKHYFQNGLFGIFWVTGGFYSGNLSFSQNKPHGGAFLGSGKTNASYANWRPVRLHATAAVLFQLPSSRGRKHPAWGE